MHTVIETRPFERAADALLSEEDRQRIVAIVSENPMIGAVMPGTGGARKFRFAGRGKGKSGGYRVITFYAADDVPVFLLDIYGKGEKVNLSKSEKNQLRDILRTVADEYRQSVRKKVATLRGIS